MVSSSIPNQFQINLCDLFDFFGFSLGALAHKVHVHLLLQHRLKVKQKGSEGRSSPVVGFSLYALADEVSLVLLVLPCSEYYNCRSLSTLGKILASGSPLRPNTGPCCQVRCE